LPVSRDTKFTISCSESLQSSLHYVRIDGSFIYFRVNSHFNDSEAYDENKVENCEENDEGNQICDTENDHLDEEAVLLEDSHVVHKLHN
jgi:hypothetical protein